MSKKMSKTVLSSAIGAILIGSLVGAAQASDNPFSMTHPDSGYLQVAAKEGEFGEGKCSGEDKTESKCGSSEDKMDGKCGGSKAMMEDKCGGEKEMPEGKCGGDKDKAKAKAEGKCGSGKCGDSK